MRTPGNKEEERRKIVFILGGSLLFVVLLCGVAYFEYGRVKKVRTSIESVEAQISASESKRKKIPALEREVIVLRENVAEYVKILPDDREINDVVTMINEFASSAGVEVTTLEDVARRDAKKGQKDPFERVAYNISLAGGLNQVMSFMGYFENHERFVKIPSFQIRAGKKKKGSKIKPRHEVELLLETFVYNAGGGSGSSRVTIPNYDHKREQYEADIIEGRRDVSIEQYAFEPKDSRRDPFLDPRVSSADAQEMTLAKEQQNLKLLQDELENIENLLRDENAQKDLIRKSEIRRVADEAIRVLATRVDQAKAENWFTLTRVREDMEKTVAERLFAIIAERGIDPDPAPLTVADLREVQSHMIELFEDGEYGSVIEQYEGLATRIDPAEQSGEFHEVLAEIGQLKDHAGAILDFEDREIQVHGIVFRPGRSTVIINGLVLVEGDPVDDEVGIAAIREDEIEFTFREIRISKLVHQ